MLPAVIIEVIAKTIVSVVDCDLIRVLFITALIVNSLPVGCQVARYLVNFKVYAVGWEPAKMILNN
jgi:hypothetical protein